MTNRSGTQRSAPLRPPSRRQSEEHLAELALQQKLEAERQKRQAAKQLRSEEHKKEEEERKRREDDKRRAATAEWPALSTQAVSPEGDMDLELTASVTNQSLLSLMNGDPSGSTDSDDKEERSPVKNKPRKLGTTSTDATTTTLTLKSSLKAGSAESYVHAHPRTLIEASIQIKGDAPVQEFIVSLQELLKNGQLVDKSFAFCSVKEDGRAKKIRDNSGIPTNMTLLSAYFKISGTKGRNPFEKQKVYKNNKEVKGELRDPTIYFSFAVATDEDPEELIARVSHEWHRRGGNLLKVKELQTFESETILCLFNVFTSTPKKTILFEFQEILEEALVMASELEPAEFHFDLSDRPSTNKSNLPAIELRQMNPKTPGQDTSHYNKLSWKALACRKVYHVECDSRYLMQIKRLAQLAKDDGLFAKMWGKNVHVSEVVDKDSTPSEIKRLARVAQVHCNYQCSMILKDLVGITDLNASAVLIQEGVLTPLRLSLHLILLRYIELSDKHSLFAELHQSNDVMGRVQAVIPNTPEAEQMILMMNKNFPAYIGFALKERGLPDDFVMELLKRSCDQSLLSEMSTCTWDPDTGVLTTQRESSENNNLEELEKAAWFKDAFADLGLDTNGSTKTLAPPPEALFNIDEDRSIKTIHNRNMDRQPLPGSPLPAKNGNGNVVWTLSDGDSASLSMDGGPRPAAPGKDDNVLASSAEVNGMAPGVADGG